MVPVVDERTQIGNGQERVDADQLYRIQIRATSHFSCPVSGQELRHFKRIVKKILRKKTRFIIFSSAKKKE